MMRGLAAAALLLVAASPVGAGGVTPGVEPGEHDVFLVSGGEDRFTMTIRPGEPEPLADPVDVLLLFDATGSMASVIDEVRSRALEITTAMRRYGSNIRFAACSFTDYGERGGPWRRHCDLTEDDDRLRGALDSIRLSGGGDRPEAYSRALDEARGLSWRPGSRRYIVLFGDAPAHDPTFYGTSTGIDPGRDGAPGTADDLRFTAVADALGRDRLVVLAVQAGERDGGPDDTRRGFEHLAAVTGGMATSIRSAGEVADAISSSFRARLDGPPTVRVQDGWAGWATVGAVRPVAPGVFEADVVVRLPPDARGGAHGFDLDASRAAEMGGTAIGTTRVVVRCGAAAFAWWRLVLPACLALLALLGVGALRAARERGPIAPAMLRNGLLKRLALACLVPVAVIVGLMSARVAARRWEHATRVRWNREAGVSTEGGAPRVRPSPAVPPGPSRAGVP